MGAVRSVVLSPGSLCHTGGLDDQVSYGTLGLALGKQNSPSVRAKMLKVCDLLPHRTEHKERKYKPYYL